MSKRTRTVVTETTTQVPEELQSRMTSHELNTTQFSSEELTQNPDAEARWIQQQRKAFMRWCNVAIAQRNMSVKNFETDLADGLILVNLIECLGGKKVQPNPSKNAKIKVQKCLNIQIALDWITKVERLKLVGIGPEDIYDGNTKLILGLIWTLILFYQLRTGKSQLLAWVNEALSQFKLSVNDFGKSWSNGQAFLGLYNYLLIRIKKSPLDIQGTPLEILTKVFELAEINFQIPRLLDAEDMEHPDEQSVMSYVSYFRDRGQAALPATEEPAAAPTPKISQILASGDGISTARVGRETVFYLQSVDNNSANIYISGLVFKAYLVLAGNDKEQIQVTIKESNQQGQYEGRYTVTRAGQYSLTVDVQSGAEGVSVSGSPFKVIASFGAFSGKRSSLTGEGATAGRSQVGATRNFNVVLRDEDGNELDSSSFEGLRGTLRPVGDSKAKEVAVSFSKNGGSYRFTQPGKYTLHVQGNDQDVEGSGVEIESFIDPSFITLQGLESSHGVGQITFRVLFRYADGSYIHGVILSLLTGYVLSSQKGAEKIQITFTQIEEGVFEGTFALRSVGTYTIHVDYEGQHVTGTPFTLRAASKGVSAAHSSASGSGLESAVAGEVANFVIETRDEFGNPVEDAKVSVQGDNEGEAIQAQIKANGQGSFGVEYTANKRGQLKLSVNANGEAVKGSPFAVKVSAGQASAKHAVVEGKGLEGPITVGQNATYRISLRDAKGNAVSGITAEQLNNSLLGQNKEPVEVQLKQIEEGVFEASYTVKKAGSYTLNVLYNKETIGKSPYTIQFVAGDVDLSRVNVEGLRESVSVGESLQFKIYVYDAFGNLVNLQKGKILVVIRTQGGEDQTVELTLEDGVYVGVFRVQRAGSYQLSVTVDGSEVKSSPFSIRAVAGKFSAAHSTASGSGLESAVAGVPTNFVVTSKDEFGNAVQSAKVDIEADNEGEAITAAVSGGEDGAHSVEYTARKRGALNLKVNVNGEAVKGSPFAVKVSAGRASAKHAVVEGEGVTGPVTVGKRVSFRITYRDEFGNTVEGVKGVRAVIRRVGGEGEQQEVEVDGNGEGSYELTLVGEYEVVIYLAGEEQVNGSPFRIRVVAGSASAGHSSASGEGLKSAVAGVPARFTVSVRDAHGNAVEGATIATEGDNEGESVNGSVSAGENGSQSVEYTARKKGALKLNVNVNGEAVKGSPFSVQVAPGQASAKYAVVEGEGVTGPIVAGQRTSFRITFKDEFGNTVEGVKGVRIILRSADGKEQVIELNENGEASYEVSLIGEYEVIVFLGEEQVKGSPFRIRVVPGSVSAANSEASGEGLTNAVAGQIATFTVQARDANGNAVDEATVALVGQNESEAFNGEVTPEGKEGRFTVNYKPTRRGNAVLNVSVNGEAIKNSPFTAAVKSGEVDPTQVTVEGEGATGPVAAGKTARFRVIARDANGNPVDAVSGLRAVLILPDGTEQEITLDSNGEGSYTITVVGNIQLRILIGGVDIKGSPFQITSEAGEASAANTVLTGYVAGTPLTVNQKVSFAVVVYDANGNRVLRLPSDQALTGRIYVEGGDAEGIPVEFVRQEDGSFTVSFTTPSKVGKFRFELFLNGQPIQGSPFEVVLTSGRFDASKFQVEGEGLSTARAGERAQFVVRAFDSFGNQLSAAELANLKFRAVLHSHAESDISVRQILSQSAGAVSKSVVAAANSVANSIGLGTKEPVTITEGAEGEKGVVSKVVEKVTQVIKGENPANTEASFSLSDETATGEYTLNHSGEYQLNITVSGDGSQEEYVAQSPYTVSVAAGALDLSQTLIEGIPTGKITIGEASGSILIRIRPRDAYGNFITVDPSAGRYVLYFILDGERVEVPVTLGPNGEYVLEYNLRKAGEYQLFITFVGPDGKEVYIGGSPYQFAVSSGAVNGAHSVAKGRGVGVPVGAITAGEPVEFEVITYDSEDNRVKVGGAVVVVRISKEVDGEQHVVEGKITDNGDGTYRVEYDVIEGGQWTVEVSVGSVAVKNSPFTVEVLAGALFGEKSDYVVPKNKEGREFLRVNARDRYGNKKNKGGEKDQVAVYLTKPIRRPAQVVDNDDGTYTVKYPYGLEKGDYQVHVEVGGKEVQGTGGRLPEFVHVETEGDEVTKDDEEYLRKNLTESADDVMSLLLKMEPSHREKFIRDLQKLGGSK